MWLVIDASKSMRANDFKPSRMDVAIDAAQRFVRDFFDQNPLAHLGIMVMRNLHAEKVILL
jgi:transcription initiation factor TFIIH subunit 2